MRFALVSLLLVGLITFSGVPATAESTPTKYFETKVVEDTAEDFAANGALDIVAVHASEKYSYNPDTATGMEVVQFRIQVANLGQMQQFNGQVPIDFYVGFKANGKEMSVNATLTQTCVPSPPPGGTIIQCYAPKIPKPHYNQTDDGVTLVLDRTVAGLPIGAIVSDIWAATATVSSGGKVYQDVAPKDNANQPEGAELAAPGTKGGPVTLQGTFDFLSMETLTPLERFVVPGGTTGFVVKFRTHDKIVGIDHVYVHYVSPPGWTITGNLGSDFITTAGGQSIEYEFTVKAPQTAKKGDTAKITMDAALATAGGRQVLDVTATASGSRVEVPGYAFALKAAGPFKAEQTSTLTWTATFEGAPLVNVPLKADFILNQKTVDTVALVGKPDGTYSAAYSFPSGGSWTVDVFVSDLDPAPHKTFDVQVKAADGSFLPSLGPFVVMAALAGLAVARRRFGE